MGQYFKMVNPDKREFIELSAKLWELCANNDARILPYLLADGEKDGTGLVEYYNDGKGERQYRWKETQFFGRWSGDKIVVAGDYGHSGLYDEAKNGYTDITEDAVREFNEFIGIPKLKITETPNYIRPDMVATSAGKVYTDPKIEVPDKPKEELPGGWRRHKTHREETRAVKRALEKVGIKAKVGHDTGTAWGWLVVNLGPNPSGMEHIKQEKTPWLCVGDCPACEKNRELESQVTKIAQEVTDRRGDSSDEITVLMQ